MPDPLEPLHYLAGVTHGLTVRFPEPLPDHAMRLMEVLGVNVEISGHELTTTRICRQPGCPNIIHGAGGYCTAHQNKTPRPAATPVQPNRKEPPMPEPANGATRTRWTRDMVIAAIQRWAEEHDGKPPTQTDWLRRGGYHPAFSTAVNVCKTSWSEAIEAAGYKPHGPGPRRRTSKPSPATAPPVSAPQPEAPSQSDPDPEPEPVQPSPFAGQPATLTQAAARLEQAAAQLTAAIDEYKAADEQLGELHAATRKLLPQ